MIALVSLPLLAVLVVLALSALEAASAPVSTHSARRSPEAARGSGRRCYRDRVSRAAAA